MKSINYSLLLLFLSSIQTFASVTISGQALRNATDLSAGQVGVFLVDSSNLGFSNIEFTLSVGSSLTDPINFGGMSVIGSRTAESSFGSTFLDTAFTFELIDGITQGDQFAFVVFETSSLEVILGDTVRLWRSADWIVPSDGSFISANASPTSGQYQQLSGDPNFSFTVVPEPSTYAAIVGLLALAIVGYRRFRS